MKRSEHRFVHLLTNTMITLAILLIPTLLYAATNVVEESSAVGSTVNLFDLVFKKGGFFMYLILLVSVAMVWLIIDAFMMIRVNKMMPPVVVEKLKNTLNKDTIDESIQTCEDNPSVLTKILAAGLRARHRGKAAMEEALAEHGAREVSGLRTRVLYLNTIATIAPMLGLLGIVLGMIKAFGTIGMVGMGKASLLANNISEALITTAGGLFIAIPAMALFFFLRNRISSLMVVVEDTIGELIDQLDA